MLHIISNSFSYTPLFAVSLQHETWIKTNSFFLSAFTVEFLIINYENPIILVVKREIKWIMRILKWEIRKNCSVRSETGGVGLVFERSWTLSEK